MEFVEPIRSKEKLEEMKVIFKEMGDRDHFMFCMGINTGLRIGDLLKFTVKDVRGKTHITLHEEKTGKTKRFYVNQNLRKLIDEYTATMRDDEYLFSSRKTKKPISTVQAWRIMQAGAKQAGLENIGTHTLRKTFGYHFYQKTKDVALLQELFNHSAPSITLRYIGINQDLMDTVIQDFIL